MLILIPWLYFLQFEQLDEKWRVIIITANHDFIKSVIIPLKAIRAGCWIETCKVCYFPTIGGRLTMVLSKWHEKYCIMLRNVRLGVVSEMAGRHGNSDTSRVCSSGMYMRSWPLIYSVTLCWIKFWVYLLCMNIIQILEAVALDILEKRLEWGRDSLFRQCYHEENPQIKLDRTKAVYSATTKTLSEVIGNFVETVWPGNCKARHNTC